MLTQKDMQTKDRFVKTLRDISYRRHVAGEATYIKKKLVLMEKRRGHDMHVRTC